MSEESAKPYLIRAIYEWCCDQGYTPFLAVRVDAQTRVPMAFVKNGEIVLNIGSNATRKLTIDNDWIQFSARFAGVSQEVAVPMAAAAGIFARETGYGFSFQPASAEPSAPSEDQASPIAFPGPAEPPEPPAPKGKGKAKLQVIK
ncbi:Stringent starvation protein B [Burkholderiales bacterium]|nr:MAG: ClpXP protease specificity-enhancing factor [Burkholderiales bacterium]CAG0955818.1 Stringent starvation protein B [Burkholderiales bacterium]